MTAPYALYYWPLPFRGHFVRYVLAHVGAKWDEPDVEALIRLKSQPVEDQPLPLMAPPVLHDREAGLHLSQMPAILSYLGRKHCLMPGDPTRDALTLKVICDAGDVLQEITCNCGATMWTRQSWDAFAADRLPRWMQIFEEMGRRHGLSPDTGHLLGTSEPGLADLASAALWHTMAEKLPKIGGMLRTGAPAIAHHSSRIAEIPAIAAMRRDCDTRFGGAYCGGQIEASLRAVLGR